MSFLAWCISVNLTANLTFIVLTFFVRFILVILILFLMLYVSWQENFIPNM